MAMLAEPRRRKRYNLCPRGKALYEDDNRFGTKMLEKMGWSKGNGLGARQDGEKDFVRIRFKNDAEGLGYEARDDQWTTHEEGFNGLLKSLNGGEDDKEANGKASESEEEARPMGFGFKVEEPEEPSKKKLKENISGMSLEERSKQSKARVHYQKFTRGKDLSRYSEKDLANIFGKKATEDIVAPVVMEEPKEEKNVSPNFGGVQTVSTGLSVSDYFKQKMEAMKNKLKNGTTPVNGVGEAQLNGAEVDVEEGKAESVSDEPLKKKKKKNAESVVEPPITETKKKKKGKRSSQDEAKEVGETYEEPKPVEDEETIAKKKKKKSKSTSEDKVEEVKEESCVQPKPVEDEETAGKKKKKKSKSSQGEVAEACEAVEDVETIAKKKKKNKKDKTDTIETIEILDEPVPKKKKSKKTELIDSEIILIDDNSNSRDEEGTNESEAVDELVRKKKKKSKKCEENQLEAEDTNEISEEKENPPKKKKKPKQEPEETIQTDSHALDSTEKSSKKKKKAKTSDNKPVHEDATPEPEPEPTSVTLEEPSFKKIKDKGRMHRDVDVSAALTSFGDKSDQSADEDQPEDFLSLEAMKQKLQLFNTYTISQFCAEKFQMVEMSRFHNSTLSEIVGYGTSEDVELKVVESRDDEQRIIDLWHNRKTNKYKRTANTKNIRYPTTVERTTIRAVKKRVAFGGI